MSKRKLKSIFNIYTIIILVCGLTLGLALGVFFIDKSFFNSDEFQLKKFSYGILSILISLLSLISLLRLEFLEIDNGQLVIRSIFKSRRKIKICEISSYYEERIEGKYGCEFKLTIFYRRQKYELSSTSIENYSSFKQELTKEKKINQQYFKDIENKATKTFGLFILGVSILLSLSLIYYGIDKIEISSSNLTSISGKVKNIIKIKQNGKARYVDIKLEEYPKLIFLIEKSRYKVLNKKNLRLKVKKGSIVHLDIFTDDYQKKIVKIKAPNQIEKLYYYHEIKINGLRSNENNLLKLDELNRELIHHKFGLIFIWSLIDLLLIIGVVYSFKPSVLDKFRKRLKL